MLHKLFPSLQHKKNQSDDFLKRIRSLVIGEGMLKEGNIRLMDFAIKNMPENGSVVEIGSYGGLSTNVMIYLLNKHQRKNELFTCDAWIYEGYTDSSKPIADTHIDGRVDIPRSTYSVYMKQSFINTTRFLSEKNLPFSFHMRSDLFFDNWNKRTTETDVFDRTKTLGGDICFAYIDGCHSYKSARSDFNHVAKHLVQGGYILFDDSADGQKFGSAQMMSEVKQDNRFLVVAKNPNYLFQKIS